MDELLGSVKRMPEGPENSTRLTGVISLQSSSARSDVRRRTKLSVIVDLGPEFGVLGPSLITHLCVVNTANDGTIVNLWVTEHVQSGRSATPPPQLVYYSVQIWQITGIMRRVKMLKSYGEIPISRAKVKYIYQTQSRAQPSGPVMSKNSPCLGWAGAASRWL
jgi:hypothetical protein